MKPGYRTTEFWLGLAALIIAALLAVDVVAQGTIGFKLLTAASITLGALGFGASRMTVKAARAEVVEVKAVAHAEVADARAEVADVKADAAAGRLP